MSKNTSSPLIEKIKSILNQCIKENKSANSLCEELGYNRTYFKNLKAKLSQAKEKGIVSKKDFKEIQDLYHKYDNMVKDCKSNTITEQKVVEVKDKSPEEQVTEDRIIRKLRGEYKVIKDKYDHVVKQLEIVEKRCDVIDEIYSSQPQIYKIDPNKNLPKGEAVAIVQLSDWHIEERVDPKVVNGLNEFNPTIAKIRSENCFRNILKLVKKERNDVKINKLILWLGGDFISGFIHEELREDNYMSPVQATLYAKDLLTSGIKFLVDNGNFEEIIIPTSVGNHGRTTSKLQISTSYKNSYEWILYKNLEETFKEYSNIKFLISESEFNYVGVYDKTLRFFHGQNVKFGGGIGGLTIPLIKAIHRLNTQIYADYNFMGHYHNLIHPTKDCTINGSLIGFGSFAQYIGASPEPPVQSFKLLDSRRGFTISAPILCLE